MTNKRINIKALLKYHHNNLIIMMCSHLIKFNKINFNIISCKINNSNNNSNNNNSTYKKKINNNSNNKIVNKIFY